MAIPAPAAISAQPALLGKLYVRSAEKEIENIYPDVRRRRRLVPI